MSVWRTIAWLMRALVVRKYCLTMENLALRQPLAAYNQSIQRPKLHPRDRIFWTWLMRLWPGRCSALVIVKPDTVMDWHRQGFRLYWRWNSRGGKPGCPTIGADVRALIRRMSKENSTWGAPRIPSELVLLGYTVAERTVAKYMLRTRKPPSQT